MKIKFLVTLICFSLASQLQAQPDTVKVGAYVISLHDINFRDKEYTMRFWLWFVYDNPDFDFSSQLDIPNAKTIEPPEIILDSLNGKAWVIMKMKCTMKARWTVLDFPFDKQHLRVQIENSLFDNRSLVFVPDILGSKFDKQDALDGWTISDFNVADGNHQYETGFGDVTPGPESQNFSTFLLEMDIDRKALGLFMKIFLGMYIAFLIAAISFIPKPWELDPRFGLPVGGLFAAVGNKYIIDSVLPETSSFTLVDSLHTITFLGIFAILVVSAICLKLYDSGKQEACIKTNRYGSWVVITLYLLANIFFVGQAIF
ncbi:MAG: hypothetical protein JJE09_07875 [Bacteroidia bacterium]|nr:hypothetical protein [Bacteroidia bacterium]